MCPLKQGEERDCDETDCVWWVVTWPIDEGEERRIEGCCAVVVLADAAMEMLARQYGRRGGR